MIVHYSVTLRKVRFKKDESLTANSRMVTCPNTFSKEIPLK